MSASTAFPFDKHVVDVDGVPMATVDEGVGRAIVFLHGNPTSSYLWRNVIPYVADLGRVVAPDLVGMGDSGKLPDAGAGSYRLVEHRTYLDGLLDQLQLGDDVILVVHDWGSGLGFDWANRNRARVRGICYMEAICAPRSLANEPAEAAQFFTALRSPAGEQMTLRDNVFVEEVLSAGCLRQLTDEEMAAYRAPYTKPGEDRRPTLTWAREIPFDGEPADVHEIVASYSAWLSRSPISKLYVHVDPGALSPVFARYCRTWPNQTEVAVRGIHFVQEDAPDDIGLALRSWIRTFC